MELFKLLGTIAVDNSGANKALDETGEKGSQAEGKLSKAFASIGRGAVAVGKTVAAGLAVAGAAVYGLVVKSVQSYADYEQLVGGVDTLFKGSSAKVQEYARKAYQTAGMSANDYMETVTGFSASLLQSLGGDTAAAAEKANMALADMSDNANKMGTDMELINNAYQGFAKQNYTMLDNLKLGYGGTKEEMERLLADAQAISGVQYDVSSYADIVDAIHVIQTEMGITGTTALEASSTISGSISSMKGAWQNLLTAISSDDLPFEQYADAFVDSVPTVVGNVLPRAEIALNGVIGLVEKVGPIIIAKIPGVLSSILPSLASAATTLFGSLLGMLPGLIDTLVNDALPQVVSSIAGMLPALSSGAGQLLTGLADFVQTNLPIFTEKAQALVAGLGQKIQENLPTLISKGLDILLGLSESILQNAPTLVATGMDLIISLAKGIIGALPDLIAKAPQIITNFANAISRSMQAIFTKGLELIWELIKGILGAIPDLIANFPKIIEAIFAVWNAINWLNLGKNLITGISSGIKSMGTALKNTAKNLFEQLNKLISNIFKAIGNGITTPIQTAKSIFTAAVSAIKSFAVAGFNALKNSVSSIFNGVKAAITNPVETAKNTIKGIIDAIKGFFNFKISWPKIPMPHFGITPSGWKIGDLLKGQIPKLGIEWYAKAMNTPIVMTKPTIWGYDQETGTLKGGGEAGPEVVSGAATLMGMIQAAVAGENDKLAAMLQVLIDMLAAYFPEALAAMRTPATFDPEAAAAALAGPMDRELGKLAKKKDRGR